MASLRSFGVGDGPNVAELWRRSAPADPISDERFTSLVLLDPNFDPEGLRLAVHDGELVGAACAMHRRTPLDGLDPDAGRGWITFFFVAPKVRCGGVGQQLLNAAVEWLTDRGVIDIEFSGYTPNYLLPGVDDERYPAALRLLQRNSFSASGNADSMGRSLEDYVTPLEISARQSELESTGYAFSAPTGDQLPWLIRLARDSFTPDWGRAIREAMYNGVSRDHIVIASGPAGETLGWAMHAAYESQEERFGPFGVLDSQRGSGVGAVLLHVTLSRMKARGAHFVWFLWADRGSAAHRLYSRAGFTVSRSFILMHRTTAS